MFLAVPFDHEAELQLLVKYFQDLECKVYHSGTPGAWNYLRKMQKNLLVLLHSDFPLAQMQGLQMVLADGSTRFFLVGPRSQLDLENVDEDTTGYAVQRIFPRASATLLTDDLFLEQPEKASDLIQTFLSQAKSNQTFSDKLLTRPGIKEWLFELMKEKTSDGGTKGKPWAQLYVDICKLCPPETEDPFDRPNLLPSSYLVSCPPVHMTSFFAAAQQGPEQATDVLVQWFAGWAMVNKTSYRRFVVCYESAKTKVVVGEHGQVSHKSEPDPKGWAQKWNHISVSAPDRILNKMTAR